MIDDGPIERTEGGALKRLLWFIALWVAGVAALAAIAYVLRFALGV